MAGNSLGTFLRLTTWGESHGKAIGAVLDGVPAGIALTEEDIQPFLDKRRPGQSRYTTQRQERDQVEILSGVFEGVTTGTPLSLMIYNQDHRSKDYGDIKDKFRPAHADYSYWVKYGLRDYRGGGRSSARETAMRVAAGAVARKILDKLAGQPVLIRGSLVQMGPHHINRENFDWEQVSENPFFCADPQAAKFWAETLDQVRKEGSSLGAVVEVIAQGIPAGIGEPVYNKLDSALAQAMMTINAVKGVEIGEGFAAAALKGPENADEMFRSETGVHFSSNHAGGILGGISTGQEIQCRFAVKPTSSILQSRKTVNRFGEETDLLTKGRHDPCVGIRAVPVGEAMMALVLADQWLQAKASSLDSHPLGQRPWDEKGAEKDNEKDSAENKS